MVSGANGGALRIAPEQLLTSSLGTFPPSGSLSIVCSLAHLSSGIDVAIVQVQVATFSANGAAIGGTRSFCVLDSVIP